MARQLSVGDGKPLNDLKLDCCALNYGSKTSKSRTKNVGRRGIILLFQGIKCSIPRNLRLRLLTDFGLVNWWKKKN